MIKIHAQLLIQILVQLVHTLNFRLHPEQAVYIINHAEDKEIEEPFGIWGGLNEVERKRNLIFS